MKESRWQNSDWENQHLVKTVKEALSCGIKIPVASFVLAGSLYTLSKLVGLEMEQLSPQYLEPLSRLLSLQVIFGTFTGGVIGLNKN